MIHVTAFHLEIFLNTYIDDIHKNYWIFLLLLYTCTSESTLHGCIFIYQAEVSISISDAGLTQ